MNRAFAIGAGMVEVDVRMSKDGVPVIMHDGTLERTTNGKGLVSEMTLAQLKVLDAGSWMSPKYAGERVPTLAEAVQTTKKNRGSLLLDLKGEGMGGAVAQVLRDSNLHSSNVLIGAWTGAQVSDFLHHLPQAQILMSTEEGFNQWESDFFAKQIARGFAGFEIAANWSPAFVAAAHARGMPVYAFTINDENAMRELIEMGIDGIETDNPSLLLALVKEAKKRSGR
jgi:glycerophosphoryl diester phosphodiesterase